MLQNLLHEGHNFGVFLLVTVALGGGAAFLAGRSIASTWRPAWHVILYMLVLGAVVRFFHMALFGGTLLSLHFYLVDSVIAVLFGLFGFGFTRRGQMARQYGFLARPTAAGGAGKDPSAA